MGWHGDSAIPCSRPVISITYDLRCLAGALPTSSLFDHGFFFVATEMRKIIMFVQTIGNSHPGRKVVRPQYLLSLFTALAFVFAFHPSNAQAQVTDDLEVNIPFQFHAGNAKLPAGEYRIHMLDSSDLSIMEISNKDGSASALFQVQETDAKATPNKDELIFNKYGNRYFLADVFEVGSSSGSRVLESQYEKRVSAQTKEAQEHVPAQRRTQQGK